MDTFQQIYERAAKRKGGAAELEELLPEPASAKKVAALSDDRWLAEMTKAVFRAGFVWQIIEAKWPGFEVAFHAFDITRCTMLSDEELEQLSTDERIVRNGTKIAAVRANAQYIATVREEHGSFGRFVAAWPTDNIVGLWDDMKKRGSRLGGQTGRYVLRFNGKDTPMLSPDVVKALIEQGVIDKEPTSKRALAAVQEAFNTWHEQSGRSYSAMSRTLACSV